MKPDDLGVTIALAIVVLFLASVLTVGGIVVATEVPTYDTPTISVPDAPQ